MRVLNPDMAVDQLRGCAVRPPGKVAVRPYPRARQRKWSPRLPRLSGLLDLVGCRVLLPGLHLNRSYAGAMSTQTGPCATCQQPTHRYGHGGNPLCPACRALLPAKKATSV